MTYRYKSHLDRKGSLIRKILTYFSKNQTGIFKNRVSRSYTTPFRGFTKP